MNISNVVTLIFGIVFIIILYFIIVYALRIMNKDMAVSSSNARRRTPANNATQRKKAAYGVEVIDSGENFDLKQGAVFPMRGEKITVGRRGTNSIILNDQYVSGNHAEFYMENNGLYVEDLNSTNGVYLNGYRIDGRVRIKLRDEIRIGSAIFRVI